MGLGYGQCCIRAGNVYNLGRIERKPHEGQLQPGGKNGLGNTEPSGAGGKPHHQCHGPVNDYADAGDNPSNNNVCDDRDYDGSHDNSDKYCCDTPPDNIAGDT